jgi:hypothetical protein
MAGSTSRTSININGGCLKAQADTGPNSLSVGPLNITSGQTLC